MVFEVGKPKTGGRKKGVGNKMKSEVIENLRRRYPEYCPLEKMIETALSNDEDVDRRLKHDCNKEVAQYFYSKKRAASDEDVETKDWMALIEKIVTD